MGVILSHGFALHLLGAGDVEHFFTCLQGICTFCASLESYVVLDTWTWCRKGSFFQRRLGLLTAQAGSREEGNGAGSQLVPGRRPRRAATSGGGFTFRSGLLPSAVAFGWGLELSKL